MNQPPLKANYLLETVVFISGAVLMIYELVGSRVLGPYLGTSIYVWTSLIGVILCSLSLGYWAGGRLADKRTDLKILALVIFSASVFIFLTVVFRSMAPLYFISLNLPLELSSLFISIILFSPASFLLGIISPYCVKIKIEQLATSGAAVGKLYAISTLGSIGGTFLAGFFLIPFFGTVKILYALSLVLFLLSLLLSLKSFFKSRLWFLFLLILFLAGDAWFDLLRQNYFIDLDSQYNRLWLYRGKDLATDRPTLNLATDPYGTQSAMFTDKDDDLVLAYTKFYRLLKHFKPEAAKVLMFGGCAYSYPKDFLEKFPNSEISVVEIDPKMTELARKYFNLPASEKLKIHHEDGRVFLNKTNQRFDAILGDAFNSFSSIPYQLTTLEAVKKKYEILNDNGLVILNIISSLRGSSGKFLRAEYATYKKVFPQVFLLPVNDATNPDLRQNFMLLAFKSESELVWQSPDQELNSYLRHLYSGEVAGDPPVLTDDYAPVEYYYRSAL